MMAAIADRRRLKEEARELLRTAQVSSRGMTALYLGILVVLSLVNSLTSSIGSGGILSTFVSILTNLMSAVLAAGFVMYCMAIRQGQRAEYLTLFDGFSFVGKVIGLNILIAVFTFLWSLLFIIPGIVKAYAYSMTEYILYENPRLSAGEAIRISNAMTQGFKGELFVFDLSFILWNLLSAISLGIAGVVYVNPYVYTAHAGMYEMIKDNALRSGRVRWEDFGLMPPSVPGYGW